MLIAGRDLHNTKYVIEVRLKGRGVEGFGDVLVAENNNDSIVASMPLALNLDAT